VLFDGQQFRVLGPTDRLPANRFQAILLDHRGRIIVGASDGRLFAYENGTFTQIAQGLTMRALGEDQDGALWAANTVYGAKWDGAQGWAPTQESGLLDNIPGLVTLTVGTDQAPRLVLNRVAQPSRHRVLTAVRGVSDVTIDAGDSRWILPAVPSPQLRLIDRDNQLWVTVPGAIVAFAPGRREPVARLPVPDEDLVTAVTESSDGLLWFGTNTSGLLRVQRSVARLYGRPEGADADQFWFFAEHGDGRLSLRDVAGTSYAIAPDGSHLVREPERGYQLTDSSGTEWRALGNVWPTALTDGVRSYDFPGKMEFRPRLATTAPAHGLWIGGVDWLARFDPVANSAQPWSEVHPGLDELAAMIIDRSGALLALAKRGLVRIRNDVETTVVPRSALPPGELRALMQDSDGDYWVGTYGGGMARVHGDEVRTLTERDGLAEGIVSTIVEDGSRGLWFAGNRGIQRLDLAEAGAFFDGQTIRVYPVLLTRLNAQRNLETSGWPAFVARDGRLWFPTLGGAMVVDPKQARDTDVSPPRVWIDAVAGQGRTMTADAAFLTPGDRRLVFSFTGISLAAAEQVRYQHRMDGVDANWVDAGTSRTATYTEVPPGRRTFSVRATRGDGAWSPPTTAVIVVEPFLWETTWFRIAWALLILGTVVGVARYRVVQFRQRADELQRVVDERTRELRAEREVVAAQAAELDQLNRAKSRLFANISHEFRTPLTLIQGPLQDMLDGAHGAISKTARELLRLSVSNAARVLRLVDQMLDLAKAETGRLRLQAREIDLRSFVLTTCEAFDAAAARGGLTMRVSVPPGPLAGWADPDHLEKILVNLIGNAIKYTTSGGAVDVSLRVDDAAADGGVAEVSVRDTGDGIPADDLPHVFERYFRARHSSARRAGVGIGLSLVKELVDLHCGQISVESEAGRGSVFTVRLPLGRAHLRPEDVATIVAADDASVAAAEIAMSRDEPVAASEVMTLVVADDSADIREYLRLSLAGRFNVLEAEDGGAALALVKERVPDLVVSDVMMPVMDGFELCRTIKGNPETEFTPVILLTARGSADSRVEGLGVGADDYLVKPFNLRELTARIDNLIASRKRWRAKFSGTTPATPPGPAGAHPPVQSEDDAFRARLRAAIDARISEEGLVADALAADLAMSRATFYRRVEQVMGQSPAELVWSVRLERAATLLAERAGTVAEIAYGLGFTSLSHFSRRFREKFGKTPSAWRQG
jgi:signal transduction histidine kinase/DNA-binding response OmpR family regulator/ligand-binding sensor domain-containing protein